MRSSIFVIVFPHFSTKTTVEELVLTSGNSVATRSWTYAQVASPYNRPWPNIFVSFIKQAFSCTMMTLQKRQRKAASVEDRSPDREEEDDERHVPNDDKEENDQEVVNVEAINDYNNREDKDVETKDYVTAMVEEARHRRATM